MKIWKLIILMMIFLVPSTLGLVSGETHYLKQIKVCTGDVSVSFKGTANDATLVNCTVNNNLWKCPCIDNSSNIIILTDKDKSYYFNLQIHYYISDIN